MSKIKLKYIIKSIESNIKEETKGIIINNELKYKENDIKVVFNYNNNTLKRESKDFIMEYDFNNENGYYLVKELDSKINITFNVKKIVINNYNIDIIYTVENDKIEYKVEVIQ